MAANRREAEKAAREVRVFEGFAEYAAGRGLRVRPGSVESRRPPEPDVLCYVEGEGPVAFELVELVDDALAEDVSIALRKNAPPRGACVGDVTMDRVRGKLFERSYSTPHPMELLAWGTITTPPSAWLSEYAPALSALRGVSSFRRIWVVNFGCEEETGVWFVDPPLAR